MYINHFKRPNVCVLFNYIKLRYFPIIRHKSILRSGSSSALIELRSGATSNRLKRPNASQKEQQYILCYCAVAVLCSCVTLYNALQINDQRNCWNVCPVISRLIAKFRTLRSFVKIVLRHQYWFHAFRFRFLLILFTSRFILAFAFR